MNEFWDYGGRPAMALGEGNGIELSPASAGIIGGSVVAEAFGHEARELETVTD